MKSLLRSIHHWLLTVMVACGTHIVAAAPALAQNVVGIQDAAASSHEQYRDIVNGNTITLLGSTITGSHIKIVDDIARAVNDGHNLRALPMIGQGGSQNIRDILYLKGVDAGIVKWNSTDDYEKEPLFSDLRNRLQYIAVLLGEEFHVVSNLNVKSFRDLAGKKVGAHAGGMVTMQDLFKRLKITPAEIVEIDFYKGLEKVKTGELDAIARVTPAPMINFNDKVDPKTQKILPVPLEDAIIETHMPGKLTHKQYPNLIPEGESIDTVATPIALAVYAWKSDTERYRRMAKFTEAFFSKMPKLLADKDRHPGWDNVNLTAELRGWKRFPPAQEWLSKHKSTLSTAANTAPNSDGTGNKINTSASAVKQEELFREFLEWKQKTGR